ncbi:MAG: hypothetical protein H6742_10045 [Alphaproteobacteria bacterium]|nr:hypothetical protein [Alphaproteobacteria bacterium]
MARKSLLNRVAGRLSKVRSLVRDSAHALNEEAAHPGEPQPHRRGHNPFHQTVADLEAAEATPRAVYQPGGDTSADPFARNDQDATESGNAWYLEGDHDGWDETNPGKKDD